MKNNAPFLRLELDFLELPDKLKSGEECIEKVADDEYRIEFVNVSFKYPGTDMYALKNVNIKFGNGRRLAVVGKNGSGKTTFIKLLCRLYDPTEGTILLNGKDIKEYDIKEYGRVFSVVFQDFALFAMPLGENVATSAVYDRNKAVRCLEEAGFGERLKSWEDGLDTMLYKVLSEKGVEISGARRRRSRSRELCIKTRLSSYWTSLPPHLILSLNQRYTKISIRSSKTKPQFTSATGCRLAVSATI